MDGLKCSKQNERILLDVRIVMKLSLSRRRVLDLWHTDWSRYEWQHAFINPQEREGWTGGLQRYTQNKTKVDSTLKTHPVSHTSWRVLSFAVMTCLIRLSISVRRTQGMKFWKKTWEITPAVSLLLSHSRNEVMTYFCVCLFHLMGKLWAAVCASVISLAWSMLFVCVLSVPNS